MLQRTIDSKSPASLSKGKGTPIRAYQLHLGSGCKIAAQGIQHQLSSPCNRQPLLTPCCLAGRHGHELTCTLSCSCNPITGTRQGCPQASPRVRVRYAFRLADPTATHTAPPTPEITLQPSRPAILLARRLADLQAAVVVADLRWPWQAVTPIGWPRYAWNAGVRSMRVPGCYGVSFYSLRNRRDESIAEGVSEWVTHARPCFSSVALWVRRRRQGGQSLRPPWGWVLTCDCWLMTTLPTGVPATTCIHHLLYESFEQY